MTTFDFDGPIDRRGTSSVKWDRYADRDVIPMWVADMDFHSPQAVIEALHRRVSHGVFGYTGAPPELVQQVVGTLEDRYRWRIEPNWIVWLPGLVTGLNVACRAVGGPGDTVMTATPVYPPFLTAPGHFGRRLSRIPLLNENGKWLFDFERIRRHLTRKTRLFLLCNPHNPVGRVFSREELRTLAQICIENDLVLCSDEIHCDLILDRDKKHIPSATLGPEIARRTITLMAPSKTFNIPGLGCSFAVVPDSGLRRRFVAAMDGIVPHVNLFGYAAAYAALKDGWPWLEALLAYLGENRDRVLSAVGKMPGLSVSPVEATYLAWIDVRNAAIPDPVRFFESAGVGLSDGKDFGDDCFVRMNFGLSRPRLNEALGRMESALGIEFQRSRKIS